MSLTVRTLFLHVLFFYSSLSYARSDLYLRLAPSIAGRTSSNNLYEMSLGDACHVMTGLEQVLPCNSAQMGEMKSKTFQASFVTGDDFSFVQKNARHLDSQKTYEVVRDLFERQEIVDVETAIQLSYRSGIFGIELEPYRTSLWVLSRNSSNPRIAVQSINEKSIAAVVGGLTDRHNSFGLKLRYTYREIISDEFSFFEATQQPENILKVQSQNLITIEPGYMYSSDNSWKARFSAVIKNWESYINTIEGVTNEPNLIWGLGATPYQGLFVWDLGLTHRISKDTKKGLSLSSQTHFKYISWFTQLASLEYTVGGSLRFRDLQASISYTEKNFDDIDPDLPLQQSFLLEGNYSF